MQESLSEIVTSLHKASNALAALGAAIDARASQRALDPKLAVHIEPILGSLGANAALERATPIELATLLGELRTYALTNTKLLFAASRRGGWTHPEAELLEAAGEVSRGIPHRLKNTLAQQLSGLSERLQRRGAAFLDVGVGVAAMSVEMAQLWPGLRVVGVDPWAPALALARARVDAAGVGDRIELREQRAETLEDFDVFDLAWIPSLFVPEVTLPEVVRRVERALRPGGWLLVPTIRASPDRLATSLLRLRTAMFGGTVTTADQIESLLRLRGFSETRIVSGGPTSPSALVVGRRS